MIDLLLKFAAVVDTVNERIGRIANWLVLLACGISAGNAIMRYAFNLSSNAWLEIQWHLFAGMVMLGAAYTLRRNEHVRVDVFYGRLSPRACAWVDLLGGILFLLPATVLLAWLAWPMFYHSFLSGETSPNPGGLKLWPMQLMLPLGFALLALQGVAEIIKRVGYLAGHYKVDTHYQRPLQ